ncbi:hypothetical protein PNEG_02599 [Pneumocystis murina B123]|uniref:Striatin N-terminal domain-containing protein n=1 Tax=Pneumocystis murina (strain B123) TaxID=1069680 RepID=M7P604_PNEMU|nr:hypothetical protein PNEG_02599 [Pneumocystis murina B123]EMR09265.1 hypothetical protein PNEG_02599 [Pneumocystis murina B123]
MLFQNILDERNNHKGEIAEYTLQGVIHFLQTEAYRYQRDRNYWEIEYAEMKAKISKLEGERKGLDRLKDLHLKRIKMLEDSLQKERLKSMNLLSPTTSSIKHTLLDQLSSKTKNNNKSNSPGKIAESDEIAKQEEKELHSKLFPESKISHDNLQQSTKRTKSRQFLEKCLQEITYLINSQPDILTDIPILYQTNPIQSHYIPLHNNSALTPISSSINTEESSQQNKSNLYDENIKISSNQFCQQKNKSFKAYDTDNIGNSIENNCSSHINSYPIILNKDIHDGKNQKNIYHYNEILISNLPSMSLSKTSEAHQKDNQIHKKKIEHGAIITDSQLLLDSCLQQRHMATDIKNSSWDFNDDNEFDEKIDENNQNTYAEWKTKFVLKNHLTNIRSVSMSKNENSGYASMATCGDDGLVKFWRLPINNKKIRNQDIIPQITYRGHSGIVTNVCIALEANKIFSSGIDSSIRCWKIPEPQRNIYAPIDDCTLPSIFAGHSNAVWDLSFQPVSSLLASISADGTIKLWDINHTDSSPLLSTLNFHGNNLNKSSSAIPTSITFLNNDIRKISVSWNNAIIRIYDIETGSCVLELRNDEIYDGTNDTQINKIISLSKENMLISGHENKYIRFYDINSAQCTYSMLGHLNAISSLDISPDDRILVSGGHDSSIRFWDMQFPQVCIQKISNHHTKAQEGVNDVSWWHGRDNTCQLEYVTSVGGDGIIKVNTKI